MAHDIVFLLRGVTLFFLVIVIINDLLRFLDESIDLAHLLEQRVVVDLSTARIRRGGLVVIMEASLGAAAHMLIIWLLLLRWLWVCSRRSLVVGGGLH